MYNYSPNMVAEDYIQYLCLCISKMSKGPQRTRAVTALCQIQDQLDYLETWFNLGDYES